MTLFWLAPAAVLLVGAVVAALAARRAAEDAAGLRSDVARWRDLRPAVVRVRDDASVLRERLRDRDRP
jgi:cytochrome c-type biogenesis protein CcmH/NrfF